MAVKIRLMRIGAKGRPFYRVVAVDEKRKRTGGYIELLGTYNPLTEPKQIKLSQERIDDWVKKGAVLSDGFLRIIGKAKQRPERKAKKQKTAKSSDEIAEKKDVEKTQETEVIEGQTEENSSLIENTENATTESAAVKEETVSSDESGESVSDTVDAEENNLEQAEQESEPDGEKIDK